MSELENTYFNIMSSKLKTQIIFQKSKISDNMTL